MSYEQVSIRTQDGDCPAYVFTPSGSNRYPAVIFYMDGLGIRPTIFEMGQRLASYGYVALVPDLFYRAGPYEPLDPKEVFASGDAGTKVGTTGYCMGGARSLTAAGTYPARIAAAASFHGGNLATDSDLSPHLLAASIAARVYVAGADQDNSYPPEMAARLDQALSDAGVDHRCEVYPDALHGWTMADFPVYNEAAAERHWDELVALFADTLT